jgi:hypothetical protein
MRQCKEKYFSRETVHKLKTDPEAVGSEQPCAQCGKLVRVINDRGNFVPDSHSEQERERPAKKGGNK